MNRTLIDTVLFGSLGLVSAFFGLATMQADELRAAGAADAAVVQQSSPQFATRDSCESLVQGRKQVEQRTTTAVMGVVSAGWTKRAHRLGCIDRGEALRQLAADRALFVERFTAEKQSAWAMHTLIKVTRQAEPLDKYAHDHRIFQLDL